MLDLYAIAIQPDHIAAILNLRKSVHFDPVYQARPGMLLPMCFLSGQSIDLTPARWALALYNRHAATLPVEKMLKSRPENLWIHNNRCAIPANCFFSERKEVIYLIRSLRNRLVFFGGIHIAVPGDDHEHFAILTTQAPDILRNVTERIPVIVSPHKIREWLGAKSMTQVMGIADRSGEQWFDYFQVEKRVVEEGVNERLLLKPVGLSWQQRRRRDEKLKGLDLRDDRISRNNTKGRR